MAVKVILYCKNEKRGVAEIVTTGALDAKTIRSGYHVLDRQRAPEEQKIEDGVQLSCRRCTGPLWFKGEGPGLMPAMPGSAKVEGSSEAGSPAVQA